MAKPRLHLIAPAGSCIPFFEKAGIADAEELKSIVQGAVGQAFEVTGCNELIEARETDSHGGRDDDVARADDVQAALADSEVAAMVLVRGGAWFTRVLDHIDFSVLEQRNTRIAVFGFSELTTLVNIVGTYRNGIGIYDMGPAFLPYGLRRHAILNRSEAETKSVSAKTWAGANLLPEFKSFFEDVVSIVTGNGTRRHIHADLLQGTLPNSFEAQFVGGNLTVLSTLIGSKFDQAIRPCGHWLVLEDFNDKIERIDRFLAHITLAGYWQNCAGVLLGDLHQDLTDLTPHILSLLQFHLPSDRIMPILKAPQVGHVWPMSPLPLHTPAKVAKSIEGPFNISWDSGLTRTCAI